MIHALQSCGSCSATKWLILAGWELWIFRISNHYSNLISSGWLNQIPRRFILTLEVGGWVRAGSLNGSCVRDPVAGGLEMYSCSGSGAGLGWEWNRRYVEFIVSPKKVSGAGWESKCWGVLGSPLLENEKVSWFSVLVSWFQKCVMFRSIYSVHITKCPFHVFFR